MLYMEKKLDNLGFEVTFNPPGDGNCFYSSAAHALGIETQSLKKVVFDYLKNHQFDDSGDDKFDFLCEEDFHDKIKPPTWDAALQKLKEEYANDMIITAFVEVMHYAVIIVTVRKDTKECVQTKLPKSGIKLGTLYFGHDADAEHYVSIKPKQKDTGSYADKVKLPGPTPHVKVESKTGPTPYVKVESKASPPSYVKVESKTGPTPYVKVENKTSLRKQVLSSPNEKCHRKKKQSNEMAWGEEEEEYNPGVPVFKGVPLFHLFQKDTEEVITISSDESEEDMMPSESTLPEKLDEGERKQHNSSGKPKKNRKKRTLSESSDKDRLKKYPEEKKMKDVDADVIDLTVSFGELSSVENTPTKMEQDHHHSRAKDDARAQLLFGAKESGSSETNPEQDDVKEDTDTKKRKRRKQKKIGEDLWTFTEREEVESLPVGIDGLNVYIVNWKDEKELKECLKDGRKWRKDCPTKWKGRERVRYADCRGSYKCNNSACPFLTEYGVRNTKQWRTRAGNVLCQGCEYSGSYVPCHARRYLCYEKKGVTVFHYGFHTCPVSTYVTKNKEEIANIIKENPNIKPSEIQSARVLSAFRRGEDWQSVRKQVESTMDKQWLANIKKKVKRDMEPVGHDYEAVITFKQYCDNNDTFYVYKVNDNRGNPDMPSFVFKMGAEKAKMAINMDRDGEHYLRDEFCFFDGKRKRCRGFVTLTASAYHPLLRKQVPLAIMEATAEDTPNIKLFWTLFNEVLQKVKRDDNYKFRPVGWCSDMAAPNMAAICDVFGSEATQYIKTCEFHFKDHRNQKSRKLDQDSSECFKLLCDDLLQSETVEGYNLAKANRYLHRGM